MQPATTNPFVIMLINMTVVFAVLWGLSLLVEITHKLDPTRKKKEIANNAQPALAAAPAAALPAAPAQAADDAVLLAVIAGALAEYGKGGSVVSVKPIASQTWTQTARVENVQLRNSMY